MLLPYLSAAQHWSGPLSFDPEMLAVNMRGDEDEAWGEAVQAYYDSGEVPAAWSVPDGVTHITIRPLSYADARAAERAAGPVSHHAAVLAGYLQAAQESGQAPDLALDEADERALQSARERVARLALERTCLALVSVTGWERDTLTAAGFDLPADGPGYWRTIIEALPAEHATMLVGEVQAHLRRIGELSPRGKGRAGSPSGAAAPTSPSGDGTAPTAATTQPHGEPGDAAAGR